MEDHLSRHVTPASPHPLVLLGRRKEGSKFKELEYSRPAEDLSWREEGRSNRHLILLGGGWVEQS